MIRFLEQLWRRIVAWRPTFHELRERFRSLAKKAKYRALYVEDIPNAPRGDYVYLVGERSYLWFAVLRCPCGCGDLIQVPLVDGRGPKWRAVKHADGTVTLHPSIWRRVGCHSHFILRRGEIIWAADTGCPPMVG